MLAEWKRKILQEAGSKIISLKYRIKVHKANPALKYDAVIEYLHELNKKYCHIVINGTIYPIKVKIKVYRLCTVSPNYIKVQ